ncbi:methyl-accepting chemotaxis protein [Halanaerobium salsuginis]|uniref:Methyl-accepting chemotaxis sensory transducer with Cache sensor n=1 Tax=Halanaerobium salsuginis TaxID=29563 RepID=A0A1I4HXB7_9FIRM|nr:methyl-accepting chemotaxis protein [Halanaerobium salsuginis]SFL46748.1 methyl-accepting chemotaxis sensory transducer with Cache sensor [Halanaerobium salsuginis]
MEEKTNILSFLQKIKFRDSLSTKIILMISVIIIIGMGGLGYLINNTVSKEITSLAQSRNNGIASKLQAEIEGFLNQGKEVINLAAEQGSSKNLADNNLNLLLRSIANNYEQFNMVYLGTTTGDMYTYPEANLPADFDPTTRPWYKRAISANKAIWTDPYIDVDSGNMVISVAKKVTDNNGSLVGVMAGDISLANISNLVSSTKVGETGYTFVVDHSGDLIAHPNKKLVEERYDISQELDLTRALNGESGYLEYDYHGEERLASFVPIPEIEGAIFAQIPLKEAYRATDDVLKRLIVLSISVLIILIIVIIFYITKNVVKPILNYGEKMKMVAAGNLDVNLNIKRKDELGHLGLVFNEMIKDLNTLVHNIKTTSNQVTDTSRHLDQSSHEVGNTSEQVSISIQDVATGADQQAKYVEDVSLNIQKLSQGINDLAQTNEEVEAMSHDMNLVTGEGAEKLAHLSSQMEQIVAAVRKVAADINKLDSISQEIGSIIDIIDNIADQTNLLALNAAIEAARAGEAGRGFSVVADEIRDLAEESSTSAEKIKKLIDEVINTTNSVGQEMKTSEKEIISGEELLDSANKTFIKIENTLKEINQGIDKSTDIVNNANKFSRDISAKAQNIAGISEETSASAEEVAAASQEQTASVEEISSIADELADRAAHLEDLIEKFDV